jgi:hypothetical protein
MLFLVDYDRRAGKLLELRHFSDTERQKAEDARLTLEIEQRKSGIEHEIVLLDAANEAALRKTHRRYFETVESMAKSA